MYPVNKRPGLEEIIGSVVILGQSSGLNSTGTMTGTDNSLVGKTGVLWGTL